MSSHDDSLAGLDPAVRQFLQDWTRLDDPAVAQRLLGPVILVGGAGVAGGAPPSTTALPSERFVAAVVGRQHAMADLPAPRLGRVDVVELGAARLVVTAQWHVAGPGGPLELVGDFLLERTAGPGLRALAYLPRTDVTAMVAGQAPVVDDEEAEPDAGAVRS
ncbi:hypothetical protein [Cellulomonas sp. SG140]|uniref:hypothetical protein n=1 Tax=Cellulomonas sp. SG140 TaxID=2976536 RepID=UPI0021E96C03|nr:hypothetical protein [Cellulomonas sp. SG140]